MMRAIAGWKDRHLKNLTPAFASFLLEMSPELQSKNRFQILVPPHRTDSLQKRGFSPLNDLVLEICKRNPNLHFDPNAVSFRHQPRDQRGLSAIERKTNVSKAFQVELKTNLPVILLDDVWTTGSTLRELHNECSGATIEQVLVLTSTRKLGTKDVWKSLNL